jgi:serine/threonine protein kinase
MAPEILKYEKYTINTDLWSVGVILYELLFNSLPFMARTSHQLLIQIEKQKYPLDFSKKNISICCVDLLSCLLQRQPDKRIKWFDFFNHIWFKKKLKEIHHMSKKHFDVNLDVKINSAPLPKQLPKELADNPNTSKSHLIFRDNYFSPPK